MEGILAVLLLIFCTTVGGLILWKLFDITRNSINNHKKVMMKISLSGWPKRLLNIETIHAEDGEKLSPHPVMNGKSRIAIKEELAPEQPPKNRNKQRLS